MILGRDKEYYLNVIILVVNIVLTRCLGEKYEREVDRYGLFHLVHWEIKGKHSTNSFYEKVVKDLVNEGKMNQFI